MKNKIIYKYRGDWSDPAIIYDNYTYNQFDVESYFYDEEMEENFNLYNVDEESIIYALCELLPESDFTFKNIDYAYSLKDELVSGSEFEILEIMELNENKTIKYLLRDMYNLDIENIYSDFESAFNDLKQIDSYYLYDE